MEWKEKTCEDCKYAIDGRCRKFPPLYSMSGGHGTWLSMAVYPPIAYLSWQKACSFYDENKGVK